MGDFGIMERDDIDKLVRESGNAFYEGGVNLAPSMIKVLNSEAMKRGIDPRYVMYLFLTQPKSRALAAGRHKNAMEVLYRLFIESSYRLPSREFSMPTPDQEAAVDEVLAVLAQWAASEFTEGLAQAFIKAVKRRSQELQRIYQDLYGEKISSSKARKLLTHELTLRTRSHPHWFKDHSLLYQMLSLLFDMP